MTMSLYCSSLLILCIATSAIAKNDDCCSTIEESVANFSSQISNTCNGPSDAAIASLQANVSALQETVSTDVSSLKETVSTEVAKVSLNVEAIFSEVSLLQAAVSAVSLHVSSLQVNVSALQETVSTEVGEVSLKIEAVSLNVSSLQAAASAVSLRVSSLQVNVSSLQTELSSKIAALSKKVYSLQGKVCTKISILKLEVSFLSNKISIMKSELSIKIATVSSHISFLQAKMFLLQQRIFDISVDLTILVNQSSHIYQYFTYQHFTSCYDILRKFPGSPSGYYSIVAFSDKVYCHMSSLPFNSNKGWIRIAFLDLYNTKDCPKEFRLIEKQGIRACGRPYSNTGSCVSTYFQVQDFKYSQMHGKLVGYQVGTPDGARSGIAFNINSEYVDGISLTRGRSRHHIWTFIAGQESNGHKNYCPCANWNANPRGVPSFVGNDYYCEGGSDDIPARQNYIYKNDPLWDGFGCGTSEKACCKPTWFSKTVNPPTSDSIELRICLDEGSYNEDVLLKEYEIYIR
uniref:Fibrinogen C-terminal domain-containing protein n=1 Tax=Amphimedon queenslandica TaxID=400682 RepID=A0A1X7TJ42_AMPQE